MLQRIVGEQFHAVGVGEEVVVLPGVRVGRGGEYPFQGVVEGTHLSAVLLVRRDAPIHSESRESTVICFHQLQLTRCCMWTPQPAGAVALEAEPLVKSETVGLRTDVDPEWPGRRRIALLSV